MLPDGPGLFPLDVEIKIVHILGCAAVMGILLVVLIGAFVIAVCLVGHQPMQM